MLGPLAVSAKWCIISHDYSFNGQIFFKFVIDDDHIMS